jgi:hypothetical protein
MFKKEKNYFLLLFISQLTHTHSILYFLISNSENNTINIYTQLSK